MTPPTPGDRPRASSRGGLPRVLRRLVGGPRPAPPARRGPPLDDRVRELWRAEARRVEHPDYRLNLVIPSLRASGTYGGVRTALDLLAAVSAVDDPPRRILTLGPLEPDDAPDLPGYRVTAPDEDSDAPRQLVILDPASDAGVAVGAGDVFLATFWTTAELVGRLRRWQSHTYGRAPARFGYLIQDFEPGFYPWSARSELARATYADAAATIAVFNTSILRDYLHGQGFAFEHELAFEPRLAGPLRAAREAPPVARARRIVAYGRPGIPRNAFPAIVEGLRAWRSSYPHADRWTVVSAGQAHPEVELGGGATMASVGKLDLAAYGRLLRSSAVGLSLMVSPHPSYPPLEMAHLGLLVLTNTFDGKDLAGWHTNITSTADISAATVAEAMAMLCDRFEADPTVGEGGRSLRPDFLSDGPPFPFAAELAALLRAGA